MRSSQAIKLESGNPDIVLFVSRVLIIDRRIWSCLPVRRAKYQITRQQACSHISHPLHHHLLPSSFFFSIFFHFVFLLCATQCANAPTSFDMDDSTVSGTLGVRKRVDSTTDSQIISNPRKRPRVSSMAGPFSLNDPISIGVGVGPEIFLDLITHSRCTISMLRLTDYLDLRLFDLMKRVSATTVFIIPLNQADRWVETLHLLLDRVLAAHYLLENLLLPPPGLRTLAAQEWLWCAPYPLPHFDPLLLLFRCTQKILRSISSEIQRSRLTIPYHPTPY